MKHTFNFNDIDCLIIANALDYLIVDEERHPLDRNLARDIKNVICETVKKDFERK